MVNHSQILWSMLSVDEIFLFLSLVTKISLTNPIKEIEPIVRFPLSSFEFLFSQTENREVLKSNV